MKMINHSCSQALQPCYRFFPCLADPARRASLGLKAALVMLHLIYASILFLFDHRLIDKTKHEPLYTALYVLLFIATLVQYFVTSGTSPGYVLDVMRVANEKSMLFVKTPSTSKQPASSSNGSLVIDVDGSQSVRNTAVSYATAWSKMVLEMYPPGTLARAVTCNYCSIEQPPRAKHCDDCGKCVLQFDHHCVWLGTCIGTGNHCKFWWYVTLETALCLWTYILFVSYLKANITKAWWKSVIMIILLIILSISLIFLILLLIFHSYLILTNQTTYELIRRSRIPYLRGIPERVFPFSQGICRNLFQFCCVGSSTYNLERVRTAAELEEKSRPYTCADFLVCRCC